MVGTIKERLDEYPSLWRWTNRKYVTQQVKHYIYLLKQEKKIDPLFLP